MKDMYHREIIVDRPVFFIAHGMLFTGVVIGFTSKMVKVKVEDERGVWNVSPSKCAMADLDIQARVQY